MEDKEMKKLRRKMFWQRSLGMYLEKNTIKILIIIYIIGMIYAIATL